MVSKDQSIGIVILLVCVVLGIFYVLTLGYPNWLTWLGVSESWIASANIQFWVLAVPVAVAFVAIMAIGAWIGYTMATTPPPKPIEEITSEMTAEEKAKEEPKTEPVETEPVKEEIPPAPSPEEEKKPERRRRTT